VNAIGAASMYSLRAARARAKRIMADLAGDKDPKVLERKCAEASPAIAAFFNSWTLGRKTAT